MKNDNDIFIFSEEHFDVLLNHALLAREKCFTANEKITETMAQHISEQLNVNDISVSKSNLLIEKLVNDFKSKKNRFWLNIFLLTFLCAGSVAAIYFTGNHNPEKKTSVTAFSKGEKKDSLFTPSHVITKEELASTPLPVTNPAVLPATDSAEEIEIAQIINGKPAENYIYTRMYIPEDLSYSDDDIPTLTDAEKKQTAKDKLKMMRDIGKKKNYGSFPPGRVSVSGSLVSVNGFSIQNAEVTNREYRTFLNDLLMQGKFDDYLLARPVSGGWKAMGLPKFEDRYWQNAKFNDFPAVNMTRKGAELYCEWLTTSMKEAIENKEVKWSGSKNPDFRLPSNAEWIYVARNADTTTVKYPWARVVPDSVHNRRGCFLCNFNYTASADYFKNTQICPGFGKLPQGGYHQPIITSAGMAIDTLLTAPVYSYNPNEWGQYCLMGNVSEMVWTYNADQPGVKGAARSMGGNWNSHVSNILIEAPEQYVGVTDASPMIGFRPMMNGYFNYAMMKQVKLK
jgi:formylglycine-generating enzyme required for sulfatase activity